MSFGILAGLAGLEHGYFEILQGNARPESLMFASMGPPCVPDKIWNACEPAMTILPNFLVTGILTVILGLLILIWSAAFVQRKNGGSILILLSVVLLLFGGGFFPPLIGASGGVLVHYGGQIEPIIAHKFPILEAAKANRLLESGQVTGNVVLLAPELL
jgi:hypothetical protein